MLTRLQADLKTAMLAKDAPRTQVLRMALSAYRNEAVAQGLGPQGVLPEVDAIGVFKRLVKSREDSIAQFEKVGQVDRAAQEQQEITDNIKSYLSRADQFAVRMSAIVGVSHAGKGKSVAGRGTVEQEALFVDKNNINLTNVPEQEDISTVAAPK